MLSLQRVFHLEENHTTVRRELLAGLATFITMAYVVVVNPQILSEAGMPVDGVLFATCISFGVATLVMGLWANYPIVLAPGMSLNAYFTYSIVLGRGVPRSEPAHLGAHGFVHPALRFPWFRIEGNPCIEKFFQALRWPSRF